MRTTALYESVLGAHSLPRLFPKPPKQPLFTDCLVSLKCRSKFFTSKLSLRNPTLIPFRYLSQWSANTFEGWFGRFLLAYESSDSHALRHPDYKSCRKTTGSTHVMDHNVSLDKAFSENLNREFLKARDVLFTDNSVGHFLKALVLFGFLTLQGSQPALAGPDIASGLQSIPYLSDLGDISTGILADLFF